MSVEVFATEVVEGEIVIPDLLGTSPADLLDRFGPELPLPTAEEAREETDWIHEHLSTYVEVRERIANVYARRSWKALGYDSWFEYLDREFGDLLRQLVRRNRVSRVQAVQDMRSQGMSTRQIGAAVGVSDTQVRRDLDQMRPNVAPDSPAATPAGPQVSRDVTPESVKPAEPQPEKITGKDGKQYPAKREPKQVEAPSTQDKPAERKPEAPTKSEAKKNLTDTPQARDAGARNAVRDAVKGFLPMVSGITPERFNEVADDDLWRVLTHCRDRFNEWCDEVYAIRRRQSMRAVKEDD